MTEQFTSIVFEAYLSGAWANISSDVLLSPAPKASRGIMSNNPEDRVADPGRLTFSLDNSAANSAHLLGYYSPGHANCRSGWGVGVRVRVGFEYKGLMRYKWAGRIEPDGIKVIPGTYGARRVEVTCVDYMGLSSYHRLNLLAPQTSISVLTALQSLIANMTIQPLSTDFTSDTNNGTNTIVYAFDNLSSDTTLISELNKICISYRTYAFVQDDGSSAEILKVSSNVFSNQAPNFTTFNDLKLETDDFLLQEDGTSTIMLDETESISFTDADLDEATEIPYGKDIYNFITTINYPRRVDAAATTELAHLQSATQLAAGASVTMRFQYLDPSGGNTKVNGTAMVTPVSGTDYKANASADGTGADLTASLSVSTTFGASEAEVTFTNTGGSTLYVGGGTAGAFFKLRGKGIYLYEPARVIAQGAASIATHGLRQLTIDMRYSETANTAKGTLASAVLGNLQNPYYAVNKLGLVANRDEKNMYAFLFFQPRWSYSIDESVTSLSVSHYSMGMEFEIVNGKTVKWYPVFSRYT